MKIHAAGWPFVLGCLGVALLALVGASLFGSALLGFLSGLGFMAAGFCAYFFRDPVRTVPKSDRYVLSPADGKIMEVSEGQDPVSSQPSWVLKIFLSVFDPHIQRAPMSGTIRAIRYKKGKFLDARDPQAAFDNEQNRIEMDCTSSKVGHALVITQIAGLIARRIVWWIKEGQTVEAGERIGLIRFGSQVDMVIPKAARMRVKPGDRVVAGESIIADLP